MIESYLGDVLHTCILNIFCQNIQILHPCHDGVNIEFHILDLGISDWTDFR